MERAPRVVLVVGRKRALSPTLGALLERTPRRAVLAVSDVTSAYELAIASDVELVLLDFDDLGDNADVVADIIRAVAPTCWLLDFSGVVRRRPDHAPVSMAHTRPLVYA